jgi:large conductance mechanosensitive channel
MIKAVNVANKKSQEKLEALAKRVGKGEKVPEGEKEPETKLCPFCLSEIPYKAKKCAHCASDIPENK